MKRVLWRLPAVALVLALAIVGDTSAQIVPQPIDPRLGSGSGRTATEVALSLGVLAFGLLVMGLQVTVMFRAARAWDTDSTRIVGLTLVVVAGLFLITAGYSQDQIAPMVGLLGTVAGYLLGKSSPASEGKSG
ncbi:MAG TPA: hypothetical protein VGM69_15275 [Chloroflexota bacterium]